MMKMMKKMVYFLLVLVLALAVTGCGKKNGEGQADANTEAEPTTTGTKLAKAFRDDIGNGLSVQETVDDLITKSGYECGSIECEEGFLNGFSSEITGFSSATMFAPYIGSIPFVGYIFETDDTDSLKQKLLDYADPRWNICTEAEETVVEVSGKYVFFIMCPGEDF